MFPRFSEDAGCRATRYARTKMADDMDSGLFNITLSDSEGEDGGNTSTEPARDRTGQTEDDFQAVKRAYRPKIDNGEVGFCSGNTCAHPDTETCFLFYFIAIFTCT